MTPKSPTALSIAKKLEILEALKVKKAIEVATEFKIGYSTVKKIRRKEDEIRREAVTNSNLSRKRKRVSSKEEIGEALIAWFGQMTAQNMTVNGRMMIEKAKQLALTFGYQDFDPSSGWLERLKVRHNIKFGKNSDSKPATDIKSAQYWMRNVLPGLIKNYDPDGIFNAQQNVFIKPSSSFADNEICSMVKRHEPEISNYEENEDLGLMNEQRTSYDDALAALGVVRKYLEENFLDYDDFNKIEDMIKINALNNSAQKPFDNLS